MSRTLINSRNKAFNLQQGRCIYCEFPLWLDNFVTLKSFQLNIKLTSKLQSYFNVPQNTLTRPYI